MFETPTALSIMFGCRDGSSTFRIKSFPFDTDGLAALQKYVDSREDWNWNEKNRLKLEAALTFPPAAAAARKTADDRSAAIALCDEYIRSIGGTPRVVEIGGGGTPLVRHAQAKRRHQLANAARSIAGQHPNLQTAFAEIIGNDARWLAAKG